MLLILASEDVVHENTELLLFLVATDLEDRYRGLNYWGLTSFAYGRQETLGYSNTHHRREYTGGNIRTLQPKSQDQ